VAPTSPSAPPRDEGEGAGAEARRARAGSQKHVVKSEINANGTFAFVEVWHAPGRAGRAAAAPPRRRCAR
jgi:hypothetical protein